MKYTDLFCAQNCRAGEGAEEMVSEIVSPYLKRLTYDKQADSATVESVVEAGLIGALTSLAYGGAQTAVKKVAGVNTVIPSELENVATYDEALKKGWDNNDKATVEKVSQAKAETLKTISQELANMSEDKRAKYIDKHNLGGMFNADGTLTDNYNNAYNGNMELARVYDTRYVSMGADVNVINSDIQSLTDNMVKEYAQRNNVSIEQATAESKPIQVYQGELSDKAQKSVVKAKKFTSTMSKIGLNNLNLVVVDENPMFNGVVVNGKNIYVGKDTFENGNWTKAIVHEILHTNEDTETYKVLADIVRKVAEGKGILDTRQQEILERYQGSDQKTVDSELTALLTEELIGNEQFIDKVVEEQPNIAMRFVKKIQNLIKLFKMSGEQRAEYKVLTLAENMYLRSAYDHGRQNLIQSIEQGRENNKQVQGEVDQNREVQYNNYAILTQYSRKTARYIPYSKIGQDNVRFIKKELSRLYEGIEDSVADGIAIEKGKTIYIIDSAKDNGEIRFGVRITRTISNDDLRAEFVRRTNNESVSKGYISDGLSSRFEDKYDNYWGSNRGQEFGEELSVDNGQSQNYEERVSREDGNRGNRRLDYSLKDSQGNELTQQQAEYFRDSKVRDEQGNLLVVYHGTPKNEFYKFSKEFIGSRFSFDDRGFFFIDRKSIAEDYATSEFSREKGRVLPCYILGEKPLIINNEYLKKNGYPRKALTDDDCIGFWDAFQGAILDDYDALKADSIIIDDGTSKMVVAFEPNQIKLTTNLNPTSDLDIRYSIKPFAEQVDDILGGKDTTSTHLKIMDTPQILQDVGLPKLPILMTARHLDTTVNESGKKGLNYHGLGIDIIKQLPKLIEKPALIAESLTRDDSVVLITQAIDKQRRPVIVAIKVNGVGRLENVVIQANVMTSAYGKDNFYNYIKKFIDNDKILFWDKKRSQRVSVNPGLQLSDVITNLASDTIIRKIDIKSQDFVSKNPTDIKQSRKSPAPSQVGDIIKAKGNLTTDKIFTKDEAKKIIADIEERLVFEDKGMVGTVKGTNELIDRLWKGLNKADKGEYTRVGVEIADYVVNHTVVEDIYECLYGDTEVDEAREVIKTLKQYFHKVKISDRVLGEIKHHFDDKASKVLSLWRAKEGGLPIG
ncbi:MAG: hypothetical protein ACI4M5_01340 [Christensenellales bacterium]